MSAMVPRGVAGDARPDAPSAGTGASWLVVSVLVAVATAWGLSFVVIKDAVADTSPATLVGWRFGIAAAALTLLRPRTLVIMDRSTVRSGVVLGVLLGVLLGLGFLLCAYGMRTTSVVASAFIVGTTVVFTPVVARVWLGRRLSRRILLAAGLAVGGLAVLTLRGTAVGGGGLLILSAALLWAVHLCGLGRWVRADRAYASTLVQLTTAALVAWLVGSLSGHGTVRLLDPATVGQLLYLGAIATAASFVAVTWAQTRVDATTTAILLTLEPVVAAVAAVVLGEPLTAAVVIGAVTLLAASGMAVIGPAHAHRTHVSHVLQDVRERSKACVSGRRAGRGPWAARPSGTPR